MSTNELPANASTPGSIDPPTQLHRQALFGTTADERAQAKRQIRANSAYDAGFWKTLDGAFMAGYLDIRPNDDQSVRGNAQLFNYDEYVDRSDEIIEEVNLEVGVLDDAMGIDEVGSSLATTIYTEQAESEVGEAEISMDGQAKGNSMDTANVPVGVAQPIVHVDYEIDARDQQQSANMGQDKEARLARQAGRVLREKEDDLCLNGWGLSVEGPNGGTFSVDGFLNTDARITGSATATWDGSTSSGREAVQDTIEQMVEDLENVGANNDKNLMPRSRGVYLYYNQVHNSVLDKNDPRGDGNMSIRQRLQQDHPYITLRETPFIPDDEIAMVVRDPRVMSIVNAQGPTNMSWEPSPMATRYKALSSRVPFFRSTYDDILGVVNYDSV
jgi:hypothetical protein